jgi:hypothetical protein
MLGFIPTLTFGDRDMRKLILGLGFSFLLAGCASVGQDFDEGKISQIQKGVTTEQEVISEFGQPTSRSVDSEGNSVLIWTYSHANAFGKANGKSLLVQLSGGKVKTYTVNKTSF